MTLYRTLQASLAILVSALATASTHAATEIRSGPARVSLVELYTSQGCSSCPPADRWMRRLQDDTDLWKRYVPLAFHVDYWDYIGWQDPFASARYSERQRRYALEGGFSTVYTPGILVNGAEWLHWRSASRPVAESGVAGELEAVVDGSSISVRYAPPASTNNRLVAHVAILGFDLISDVTAGENSGKKLRNDFVVLGLREAGMNRRTDTYFGTFEMPSHKLEVGRCAVAIWVSREDGQAPLQSAGGWLPDEAVAALFRD